MIRISVLYPSSPGARFDHDYYLHRHMPLVQERMGAALLGWGVERGLRGVEPGSPPEYVAVGRLHCASVEAFEAAFGPHAAEILGDLPNYTDLTPVIQVSEVVVD